MPLKILLCRWLVPVYSALVGILVLGVGGCRGREGAPAPAPEPEQSTPSKLSVSEKRVEVREGRLFVDGDRFIVRGVGYDPGSRPGQYPWSRKFDRKVMAADLERMKEAGFNTVRGWSGFNDQELSLIANHDLWVIQGIWFDPSGDFADPEFRTAALRTVSEIVERSAKHDHILMYLVMNEPSAESILKAGEEATREFLTELKTRVNELHPGVPVSFANTIIGDFFDVPAMDVDAFNGYMYAPITMRVLGYRGFLEWWRKNRPAGQPLVVTEFGLSVSPTAKWEGRFSYGGNSPEDQALGNLWMLESLFQAGAQGSCAFLFHDGWWKNANTPDDAMTHDDDPEEWYGIIGIESMDDPMGEPRPAYHALQKANQVLWLEPVSWKKYDQNVPFEAYLSEGVTDIQVKTASGRSVELVRNGNWCRGQIPATDLTGLEPVTFTAQTPFGPVTQKRTILTDWAQVPAEDRLVTFVLEKEPPSIGPSDPIELVIRAVAVEGGVVANRKFVIGYFPHEGWEPGYSFDVVSDSEGRISMKLDPLQYSGIITLSVSTGHEPLVDKPTWGEAWILRVGNAK